MTQSEEPDRERQSPSAMRDGIDEAGFLALQRAKIDELKGEFAGPDAPPERYLRAMLAHVADIVIFCAVDGTRLFVTPSMGTILGVSVRKALSLTALDMIHPDDKDLARALWRRVLRGDGDGHVECLRYRHEDGRDLSMETSLAPVFDPSHDVPIGVIATLRDVTVRREVEERIAHMARHDALTDLPNRELHHATLARMVAERDPRNSWLLFCDLDGFKAVNDALGHLAGDQVLRNVAGRLKAVVGDVVQVARIGGDEFSIILAHHDVESVNEVSARLIDAVSKPMQLGEQTAHVGLSIGFVALDAEVLDVDDAVSKADIALYHAKEEGRNTYRAYQGRTDAGVSERRRLRLDIGRALELRQFALRYQPVMSLSQRRIVSCEALLRWRHPELGELLPGRFIQSAEQSGQIVRLGAWVISKACENAARLDDDVGVAVNVSPTQLRSSTMSTTVQDALTRSGMAPRRLRLEVTEAVFMHDGDRAVAVLDELRSLGVTMVLDDFGLGRSSIGCLRRFRFDEVKMDRSFVQDMTDVRTAAMAKGVVETCRRLGIDVVAEGVETAEQLRLVATEGVDLVQGHLLSPPRPVMELSRLIDDGSLLARMAAQG